MEIVLGIDNIVFIAVLADRLPSGERATARTLGLAAALVTRLGLLCGIWLIMMLDEYHVVLLTEVGFPEAWLIDGETNTLNEEVNAVTPKDLLMLAGGLFLIWKSVHEIHKQIVHTSDGPTCTENGPSLFGTIVQIGIMDLIFSIDSVITAVGMANQLWVMITAVIVAIGVMLAFSGTIGRFIERYPTLKTLALSFLILIGVLLVAEGIGTHMDKGYIYFAMAFALAVEMLNIRVYRTVKKGGGT